MIEQVLPLAHSAVLLHHTVVGALSHATAKPPAVATLPSPSAIPPAGTSSTTTAAPTSGGLLSGTSLGSGALNAGTAYTGLSAVNSGIDSVAKDVAHFGDVFAFMGVIWGGLVHTHVFHNERAPEQSKTIVKGSIIGLGTMLAAPTLVSAMSSI